MFKQGSYEKDLSVKNFLTFAVKIKQTRRKDQLCS